MSNIIGPGGEPINIVCCEVCGCQLHDKDIDNLPAATEDEFTSQKHDNLEKCIRAMRLTFGHMIMGLQTQLRGNRGFTPPKIGRA